MSKLNKELEIAQQNLDKQNAQSLADKNKEKKWNR